MKLSKNYAVCCLLLAGCSDAFSKKNAQKQTQKGSQMITQGSTLDVANYTKHSSGIQFQTVKPGSGAKPLRGETVTVDYTGWLLKGADSVGTKFDSSVDRGQKFKFPVGLGHVISGWDMMVADMNVGEKRVVILPPAFGYGSRGAGAVIPGNATLIFEIELFGSN